MRVRSLLFLLAFALCAVSLWADPVTVDAGWYGFCFLGSGSPATAGCQNDGIGTAGNTITFTSAAPVWFKITDAFDYGDSFDVIFDGTMTVTTPSVPTLAGSTSDPNAAWMDPGYSKAAVYLSAGSHTADIFAHDSPWGGGGAYFQVASAVPEPGTFVLLGGGLLAAAVLRRRKG